MLARHVYKLQNLRPRPLIIAELPPLTAYLLDNMHSLSSLRKVCGPCALFMLRDLATRT